MDTHKSQTSTQSQAQLVPDHDDHSHSQRRAKGLKMSPTSHNVGPIQTNDQVQRDRRPRLLRQASDGLDCASAVLPVHDFLDAGMEVDPMASGNSMESSPPPTLSSAEYAISDRAKTTKTLALAPAIHGMEPCQAFSSSGKEPVPGSSPLPQDSSAGYRQDQLLPPGATSLPGAFPVRRSRGADDYGRDDDDESFGRQRLEVPHVVGTATLVEEPDPAPVAPAGPLVIATVLKRSLLSNRKVQAAIGVVVLAGVGLVVWALTTRSSSDQVVLTSAPSVSLQPSVMPSLLPSSSPSTETPSMIPSVSPSFSPGTLVGRFCSQDPFNGYGGDFCPFPLPCRPCPSPNERLSVCLSDDSPLQVLQVYCTNALRTSSRPCGINYPACPLEHYCIPCGSYAHPAVVLEGQVCVAPGSEVRHLQEEEQDATTFGSGYLVCQYLNDNGGTFPPTPPPTPQPIHPIHSPPWLGPFGAAAPTPPTAAPSAGEDMALEVGALLNSVSLDGGDALETPGTAQSLAFEWLLANPLLSEYSDEETIQRYALAVLYYSTGGDQWTASSGYLSNSANVCDWSFVTCNADTNAVVQLSIQNNGLKGPIPPEMHLLESLVFMGFYSNSLSGSIPTEIGRLSNLVNMDLDSNKLEGVLPTHLGDLQDLQYLYLNNNQLTGSIPTDLGRLTNLESLLLSNNQLTGSVPNAVCELGLGSLSVLSVDVEVECSCGAFVDTCHPVGS